LRHYYCHDHQGKAGSLTQALNTTYEPLIKYDERALFVLTDNDVSARQEHMIRMWIRGCRKFFVYPHSGRVNLYADIFPPWNRTTVQFVSAAGHVDIMRAYGYQGPLEVIGWHLCALKEFTPTIPRNILFAPIHPRNGAEDREANLQTFKMLVAVCKKHDMKLTVRYLPPFDMNGIPRVEGVEYVEGRFEPAVDQIDRADLVVAHQTFAYLAVARGKPLLAFGEDIRPHTVYKTRQSEYAKTWDTYKAGLRYPVDITDSLDVFDAITRVCSTDVAKDWRLRMIGEDFSQANFLYLVDKWLDK
jgi:hypothetical protein